MTDSDLNPTRTMISGAGILVERTPPGVRLVFTVSFHPLPVTWENSCEPNEENGFFSERPPHRQYAEAGNPAS